MKKYTIYIGILVAGLVLGWLFFGNPSHQETEHNHNDVAETNQMWTCSMHPQIMQPEPGDCPICGMDLIPAESGSDGLMADQFKLTENAMALANIETTVVGSSDIGIASGITLSGKITENEDEAATMPAHFNGRIEKLFITSIGQRVKKGQIIAQVYSPDIVAAQQELITAYKNKDNQPQLYKAVRNKFKNWMLDGSQLDAIETSGQVKTHFPIYSHVSGVVTEISVTVGAHIMMGLPIFKVANLNTVWANFDVYENQIGQFKKGEEVSITTNAYPNKTFKGAVDFINPVLNTNTRTVTLRVVLNNKDAEFKPGMFVEGSIKGTPTNKEQVLTIPASAILWTGERSVVYLKTNPNEPVFEMREITLGNQIGDYYNVLDGLHAGDEIVTNGTFTVDAAAQLQGKKSMMNKDGDKAMTDHEGHSGMNENRAGTERQRNTRLSAPKAFQEQLNTLFKAYMEIEKTLVEGNGELAQKKADSFLKSTAEVDASLLTDNKSFNHWARLEKELKAASTPMSETTDIAAQRDHFIHLSAHLINAVESFGIGQKVYVDFCPMANNNVGAYWLSPTAEIYNPYFGDAMLSCGSVKQVIEE
jgi:Cu(I)/Ag(I) efflux system membrane fusion protein